MATDMKTSARNVLKATVLDVKEGPVKSQVHVDIRGGNTVTSMITTDARPATWASHRAGRSTW
jgi:molybdopterin-binding protein